LTRLSPLIPSLVIVSFCNAPHSFVGLASKYFVRKEGV
jgi:hypothetical protein